MVAEDSFGPGPRQWPPGSSLWSLHRDPIAYMTGLQRRHGDLVHWRIGPQDVVMVARSDLARDVLVTHHRSFKKGPGFERAQIVLGQGLLTSDGEFHLRHRRIPEHPSPIFKDDVPANSLKEGADGLGRLQPFRLGRFEEALHRLLNHILHVRTRETKRVRDPISQSRPDLL